MLDEMNISQYTVHLKLLLYPRVLLQYIVSTYTMLLYRIITVQICHCAECTVYSLYSGEPLTTANVTTADSTANVSMHSSM